MSAPPQSSSPVNIPRSPPQFFSRPNLRQVPNFSKLRQPDTSKQFQTPDFKPILHTKDAPVEELVIDLDQTDTNYDLVKPHSDSDNELAASREIDKLMTHVQQHPLVDSDRLNGVQIFAQGIIWLFILFTGYSVFQYKLESSAIGFCDTGSNTSKALQELLAKRLAIDECIGETAGHISEVEQGTISNPCPMRPLVSLPHPKSCSPCPEHASCGQFEVYCDSGYLIQPTILLSFIPVKPSSSKLSTKHASYLTELLFQVVSTLVDGLPGLGSVGLPPRCAEDPQRRHNFDGKISQEDAIRWGVEVESLKEVFRKSTTVCSFSLSLLCVRCLTIGSAFPLTYVR